MEDQNLRALNQDFNPPTESGIDWDAKPAPWCWIGPQFRAECEAIAGGRRLPPVRRQLIGEKLRERRIALGMTQPQFCAEAKISVSTLKHVEHSRHTTRSLGLVRATLDRLEENRRLVKKQAFR